MGFRSASGPGLLLKLHRGACLGSLSFLRALAVLYDWRMLPIELWVASGLSVAPPVLIRLVSSLKRTLPMPIGYPSGADP